MNNKKINFTRPFFSLLMVLTVFVWGCNPLDITPTTHVGDEQFWNNPALARNYVNDFYTWTPLASGHNFQSEQWSDNCLGNNETDWNTYRQEQITRRRYDAETGISVDLLVMPWATSYNKIRAVNIGIEKIGGSTVLGEAQKAQLLGESYFFRAWVYFEMEQYWGTVPYVDKVLTVFDETFLPRIKREALFDNMLSDLDNAILHLKINTVTPDIGIVNVAVAQAFKSRVALFAGCAAEASENGIHSYDDPSGLFKFTKTSQHYYDLAYNAAKEVINANQYDLEEKYIDLFTSDFSYKSVESIWPVLFNLTNRSGFNPTEKNGPDGRYYGNNTTLSWEMRSGIFPTQDLVDCYYQKDDADNKYKPWWLTQQARNLGVTGNANGVINGTGKDYRNIFKDRDSRFYATVTYDGAYMGPPSEARYEIQTWIDNSNTTPGTVNSFQYSALHSGFRTTENISTYPIGRSASQTITGYYSRKYSRFDKFFETGALNKEQRTTCYFNIRYAEVLLNCAEAAIKLNKGDELTYINKIRDRAGIGDYDVAIAGHDVLEECKLQRRIEFAFESPGFRYFDLLRWGEAAGKPTIEELNTFSRGIHIFRKGVESKVAGENLNGYAVPDNDPSYFTPKFETAPLAALETYERKFNHPRYYFYPISSTLQSTYKNLIQNPGWTNTKWNN